MLPMSNLDMARWLRQQRPDLADRLGLVGAVSDIAKVRDWRVRLLTRGMEATIIGRDWSKVTTHDRVWWQYDK